MAGKCLQVIKTVVVVAAVVQAVPVAATLLVIEISSGAIVFGGVIVA